MSLMIGTVNRLALTAARLTRELGVIFVPFMMVMVSRLALTTARLMLVVMMIVPFMMVVVSRLTLTATMLMRKFIIYETTFNILDRENIFESLTNHKT